MDMELRKRMAAESILENEALRAGWSDESASALLKWGTDCAKHIIASTAHLEGDEEANELVYPRMRALRDMLRTIHKLYAPDTGLFERGAVLKEIAQLIPAVYGEGFQTPELFRWSMSVIFQAGSLEQKINQLRVMIEGQSQD
jgi:hypothetical protein